MDNITTQFIQVKDKSLWSSQWYLIRTHHNYPYNFWKKSSLFRIYHKTSQKLCIILKRVTNFCPNLRYADHNKTPDKYGGPKKAISIWAPSHAPHIPKIARNWNSLHPETTLSKNCMSTQNSLMLKISNIQSCSLQKTNHLYLGCISYTEYPAKSHQRKRHISASRNDNQILKKSSWKNFPTDFVYSRLTTLILKK